MSDETKLSETKIAKTSTLLCNFHAAEMEVYKGKLGNLRRVRDRGAENYHCPDLLSFATSLVADPAFPSQVRAEIEGAKWAWRVPALKEVEIASLSHPATARLRDAANAVVAEWGLKDRAGRTWAAVTAYRVWMRAQWLKPEQLAEIESLAEKAHAAKAERADAQRPICPAPQSAPVDLSKIPATKQDVAGLLAELKKQRELITDLQVSVFHLPERTVSAMDHATSGEQN